MEAGFSGSCVSVKTFTAIHRTNAPPTSLMNSTLSNCAAISVRPIRKTTAAAAPKAITIFRCSLGNARTAIAMTSALSPASRRSIRTIDKPSVISREAEVTGSTDPNSARSACAQTQSCHTRENVPMPAKVNRVTVDLTPYPDLVVIYLGMRANSLRGLKTVFQFGPRISAAVASKPDGLLLHENLLMSLFPLHVGMRQY